jgi:catechol 2,3-dioxygenase-like lactoylglutathione lyase family enzyme
MIDHVMIRAADRAASERFYETVLGAVGIEVTHRTDGYTQWDDFALAPAGGGQPATRGLHIGFVAPSREAVDAFWRVGTEAGYEDDGAPGERPQYTEGYYGAFLLDPDGNSAEAVHHPGTRDGGNVDHLWIRVGDLDAAKRFYALAGEHAGFSMAAERPGRGSFSDGDGGFSVVVDERPRTEHLHLAFAAPQDAVDAFHREAMAAGHRDNGAPGERPRYHPGYYAAFVLDPDGHNVELVDHHR